jgi:hypothetical protein
VLGHRLALKQDRSEVYGGKDKENQDRDKMREHIALKVNRSCHIFQETSE